MVWPWTRSSRATCERSACSAAIGSSCDDCALIMKVLRLGSTMQQAPDQRGGADHRADAGADGDDWSQPAVTIQFAAFGFELVRLGDEFSGLLEHPLEFGLQADFAAHHTRSIQTA